MGALAAARDRGDGRRAETRDVDGAGHPASHATLRSRGALHILPASPDLPIFRWGGGSRSHTEKIKLKRTLSNPNFTTLEQREVYADEGARTSPSRVIPLEDARVVAARTAARARGDPSHRGRARIPVVGGSSASGRVCRVGLR